MTGTRITKRLVDGLKPTGREYVAWDDDLPGFGVRVRATGAKSYIVQYRAGSGRAAPTRKVTLGAIGKLTPDEARAVAKRTLGSVAQGADPASAKRQEREALTVAKLAEMFLAEHVKAKRKGKTVALYRLALNGHVVPELGARKATNVAKADMAKLHRSLQDRPYLANRVIAVASSMYAWAARHGLVGETVNPAARIDRFPEDRRERFLNTEELERLGAAIREAETTGIALSGPTQTSRRVVISPYAAAALRLLLFTGARVGEILTLRWEHVDLERGLLLLPDSKTGRKTIVLNAPALAVLTDLPRAGAYVIASATPEKPRSDLKRQWALVSKRAGLDGVRIHDLRHTFASFGAGGRLGLPIIGKLLGHTQASTTHRYAHLDVDPLRLASEAIASRIAAATGDGPAEGGSVVPLQREG